MHVSFDAEEAETASETTFTAFFKMCQHDLISKNIALSFKSRPFVHKTSNLGKESNVHML